MTRRDFNQNNCKQYANTYKSGPCIAIVIYLYNKVHFFYPKRGSEKKNYAQRMKSGLVFKHWHIFFTFVPRYDIILVLFLES